MTLCIDDTKEKPMLTIYKKGKVVLKKRGTTIKQLLKFVLEGTSQQKLKDSIMEFSMVYIFMKDSKTTIELIGD